MVQYRIYKNDAGPNLLVQILFMQSGRMKVIAYIFLICIPFYTVEPLLLQSCKTDARISSCPKCCGIGHKSTGLTYKSNTKTHNTAQDTGCSPFKSCGCCSVLNTQARSYNLAPKPIESFLTAPVENHIKLGFTARCWKPPKWA